MQIIAASGHGQSVGTLNARYVWLISCAAAMGGLLFGYDWVVIGGAKPFYEKYFQLSGEQLIGWANSCALLGCLLGSLISGWMSDRFGRKKLLLLAAILFAVSSGFTGLAASFQAFVIWRIAGGVAIGIASNVSPTYIAEISPAAWRGRLVALNQLTITVGILAAQIVNWLIADKVPAGASAEVIRQSWNGQFGWRWMFAAVIVPSLIFFAAAAFVPESPRWQLKIGLTEQARATLFRIGGNEYAREAMQEIQETLGSQPQTAGSWSLLLGHGAFRALLIGICLAVLQQWSGINVIFNYAEEIYHSAGYDVSDILFNIVITGTINLVFTLAALGFVDNLGRRPLMLFGCAGIGISHFLIGLAYRTRMTGLPVLLLTLCAVACYTVSPASYNVGTHLRDFPEQCAGVGHLHFSLGTLDCVFRSNLYIPFDCRSYGSGSTFWLYSAICFAGFVFIFLKVPETKGKTLEEIEHFMAG